MRRKFQVTLEREITVWQLQEIEVEAADEEEAERKAILVVEDDDFDQEKWEVMDCDGYEFSDPPSAVEIRALPQL